MPYNEVDVIRALQRTVVMTDATEAADVNNIEEFVLVRAEDAHALREVALARRDNEGQAVMSLTLEALNSKVAVYGPAEEQMRISRTAYEALGRPPRLNLRIDGAVTA